ncbi:MAG: chloride channel protein [Bacteroidota bacterium]|nr:chloride channel protein [Bacteroidota bacterium]
MWAKIVDTGKSCVEFLIGNLRKLPYEKKFIENLLRWLPYLIGSILTAVIVVSYSKLFDYSSSLSHYIKDNFPWLFFIITPVGLLAGWLIVHFLAPGAGGSGIPQLMAAVNAQRDPKRTSTGFLVGGRVLFAKIVGSLIALLGGGVIGREGPTIQISGSVYYVTHKFLPKDWPKMDRERMLIAGGAAGLAAAFNTPLGGIVFAIEELSRSNLNAIKSTLLYAVIFSGMTVQWILGPYLYLGYPHLDVGGFSMIGYVILFSAVAGIAGAANGKLIFWLVSFVKKIKKISIRILYILGSGLVVATLIYFNENSAFGPGKDVMNDILFDKSTEGINIFLFISRFFATIISYATGVAGGIFAPSLSSGSILGKLMMDLFNLDPQNKVLILVAMIGFLTGVTRTPFTSSILVLEMTDSHSAIFLFILAGLISSVTARIIDKKPLYRKLEMGFL